MIDLNPNHLGTVTAILAEHVPECEVRAFGSRATWTARDYSDLDLAVVGEGPLDWRTLSKLKEAFEESDLPMRVDVLDWHATSESFRKVIERDYVALRQAPKQTQPSRWRTARWGDLATLEYGKSFRDYDSPAGPYRVYGTNGPIGWHSEPLCPYASVIIGRKGAYRGVHYSPRPFFVIDTAFYLKPKVALDTRWAYYQLLTQDINGMDSGTAIPSTSRGDFYGLSVEVPPLPEQRAIAHVLGTLDDKIELNRRMNETLEEMARALFKSWFVDFEPVRAKMEGHWRRGESLPGLPAEHYDLFPDRLVDSELGQIPEGWDLGTVSQLAERIQNGGTPRRSDPTHWEPSHIPWLTSSEVRQSFVLDTQNYISRRGLEHSSAKMIPARSILVALYGATAGQVSMNIRPLTTNQAVSAIIPSDGNRYFCLVGLRLQVGELGNRAVGSAQQNISKKAVESTTAVLPPIELRLNFDTMVEGLFERIYGNLGESRALAAQRDALLPKLVSREMGV